MLKEMKKFLDENNKVVKLEKQNERNRRDLVRKIKKIVSKELSIPSSVFGLSIEEKSNKITLLFSAFKTKCFTIDIQQFLNLERVLDAKKIYLEVKENSYNRETMEYIVIEL